VMSRPPSAVRTADTLAPLRCTLWFKVFTSSSEDAAPTRILFMSVPTYTVMSVFMPNAIAQFLHGFHLL